MRYWVDLQSVHGAMTTCFMSVTILEQTMVTHTHMDKLSLGCDLQPILATRPPGADSFLDRPLRQPFGSSIYAPNAKCQRGC